ncbi:MAG: DUF3306 domain-containing protein [Gammaproteobacteria bacterium]|nr:DUF3306 domain-containing protein [Gammaproteobacteria bacterium]
MMAKDPEQFLSRWSRLKRAGAESEQAQAPGAPSAPPPAAADASRSPVPKPADEPLPELPSIDELTPESDFRPFMDPRVPEALRRLALKKLYADPHFNVQDMLDDYAGDYTLLEALPPGMASKLTHARRTLLGQDEADRIEAEEAEQAAAERIAADGATPLPAEAAELPGHPVGSAHPAEDAQSVASDALSNRQEPSKQQVPSKQQHPRKQNG